MRKALSLSIFLWVVFLLAGCQNHKPSTEDTMVLDSRYGCVRNEWQFLYKGQWYPATVPGNIHDDLLRNGLIPDPFVGTNEDSVQWVSDSIWTYRLIFDENCADEKQFTHKELIFDGLDTYTEVLLNGKKLSTSDGDTLANNMFRKWVFPVEDILKKKNNELIVRFLPTAPFDSVAASRLPYRMPDNRVFTRKAQYESGWDWGPRLNTCGIWKDVSLRRWNGFRLEDVYVCDTKPTLDTNGVWETSVEVTIVSDAKRKVRVRVDNYEGNITKASRRVTLKEGINKVSIPVSIKQPRLWWPNGMGDPYLYYFYVSVDDYHCNSHTIAPVEHGLRTIELRREKDSIGESFAFVVNGKPCFMRGANWIPASSYPGTLKAGFDGDYVYYQLLKAAQDVNMNMIRVWGGGLYENEEFYRTCDRFGLLVWQDFMFACNPYPADKTFLENVRREAEEQVVRLRNHPCLALWNGNNEVHNGLGDWGWPAALGWTEPQYQELMGNYSLLFEKMISDVVRENASNMPYIPTSPTFGWGHPECTTHGCSHYWGVWWGELPFEVWWDKTGRFMAEYGFQSYPEMATWRTVEDSAHFDPHALSLGSATMRQHQKHGRGVEIIRKAMKEYFGYERTADLGEFAHVSQLVQAYGITRAIDAHRIRHDRCRGTLYWQLNDCWPVASWSSIDFTGRWKALHYRLRDAYANVAVATRLLEGDALEIFVVNDSVREVAGELQITLYSTDGNRKIELPTRKISIPSDGMSKGIVMDSKVLDGLRPEQAVLHIRFVVGGKVLAEKVDFLVPPARLELKKQEISREMRHYGDYDEFAEVTLVSPVFQYGVFVEEVSGKDIFCFDNYFHLLPGVPKTVHIDIAYDAETDGKPTFRVRSLYTIK
ncbi:MAG: hypothetical protein K5846_01430 [Bacteroidales bacterium]|nr:hypothetical protein [Bacteroidales bacterium]